MVRGSGRLTAVGLVVILVAGACSSAPPPSLPPGVIATPVPTPFGNPSGTPGQGTQGPQPTDGGVVEPGDPEAIPPLPADIVADVDAIMTASTAEAKSAAIKHMLEKVGAVVTDDPATASPSAAGMYIAPEEVAGMADQVEPDTDYSRATLAEFANTFGAVALLPPNDALAADLPSDWPDGAAAGVEADANLDVAPLANHLVDVLNGWVNKALAAHTSDDANLVMLTNAPLYLAEMGRRQSLPVDLRKPFLAEDLHLGWLELTVLTAGMRSMLIGADAVGLTAQPARSRALAGSHGAPFPPPPAQASGTPCDTLKTLLEEKVPFVPTSAVTGYIGAQIKEFITSFVFGLAGESAAEIASNAFKALSILYKVQALMLLYQQAKVQVLMEPISMHKPVDQLEAASATVIAGIPDDQWEAAKQSRALTPFDTAVRECARFVGLPVYSDSVTLGDAVKGWQVRWSVESGAGHVQIPAGDDWWVNGSVPGRLQRRLSPVNDHTGNDILAYQVRPERREDHPGIEHEVPVILCAHIVAGEPPDGFQTILKAGFAGASLAGGNVVSLVAVIAKLLIAWVATVNTIDGCGKMDLSFHVAKPSRWHGTITVSSSVNETTTETGRTPDRTHDATNELHESLTDSFYVGGDDPEFANDQGGLSITLDARQYTQGAGYIQERSTDVSGLQAACHPITTRAGDWGGGWWFDADTSANLEIDTDGSYQILLSPQPPVDPVEWPGELDEDFVGCPEHNTRDTPGPQFPTYLIATPPGLTIINQFDPTQPVDRLAGSMRFENEDGTFTSRITWNLTHDGTIKFMTP